jgi:hypothetical protein
MQSATPTAAISVRRVDRAAIARSERHRQVVEALEGERDRAAALEEQIVSIVLELEGPGVDEAVFASMAPEDVEIVRRVVHGDLADDPGGFAEEWLEFAEGSPDEDEGWQDEQSERDELEAEIVRLRQEITSCERQQQALERYLAALG